MVSPNPNASTGPKTPEGKAKSSMNALKHGLTAKVPLLPGEDAGEFRDFVWSVIEDLEAEGPVQLELAHRAAVLMWKQRRIHAAEEQAFHVLREKFAEAAADRLEEKEEFAETPEDFKALEEAKAEEKEYGAIWGRAADPGGPVRIQGRPRDGAAGALRAAAGPADRLDDPAAAEAAESQGLEGAAGGAQRGERRNGAVGVRGAASGACRRAPTGAGAKRTVSGIAGGAGKRDAGRAVAGAGIELASS